MAKSVLKPARWIFAAVLAASPVLASDPGDLFPDVSYDKTVRNPVKNPGKARPRSEPPHKKPPATSAAATRPAATRATSTSPVSMPAAAATQPERENAGTHIWGPYSLVVMQKFLNDDEQAEYDKDFAEPIKKALDNMSSIDRKALMDNLTEAAANRSENVKRFVLLNVVGLCVKNSAPLEERSARALLVVPLLTEQTLEVAEAKADCLNILAFSAPEMASDKLWAMLAESEAILAKLQVQTGFPTEARESFAKARVAFLRMRDRRECKSEILVEAGAWVDYAVSVAAQLPNYRKTLAGAPTDPDASTRMAMAHLVLYADLEGTRVYAVNATDALKALAAEIDATGFPKMSEIPSAAVKDSVKLAEKLLPVAREAESQIEKYTIAKLIVDRLDLLKADYPEAVAKERAFNNIRNDATRLMKETAFKPVPPPAPVRRN